MDSVGSANDKMADSVKTVLIFRMLQRGSFVDQSEKIMKHECPRVSLNKQSAGI